MLAAGPDSEEDIVEHGDGWDFHSPLGFRLAQVVQHGTDHRSQICTALTSLGVEPPAIDLWAYGDATKRSRGVELGGPRAMADPLRVVLEVGKKRKVVAGAMDWPGLDRGGSSEEDVLEKLLRYVPRYAGVAERAGLADAFSRADDVEVVERVPGSSSTDFWGIAHVPSEIEREVLADAELERRLDLLRRAGPTSTTSRRGSRQSSPGSRSGGRSRDQIIRHVYATEPEQNSRKVEVRTPREVVLTPEGLAAHRRPTSTRSVPTTPRASRRGPGRSSSSSGAPRTTPWITRGSWRTATPRAASAVGDSVARIAMLMASDPLAVPAATHRGACPRRRSRPARRRGGLAG